MTQELSGRVAIVTGAGRNIGRAIALALADGGAAVMVNARSNLREAEAVVGEIERTGGKAIAVTADVVDADAVGKMVDAAAARFGRIDILVNNAGLQRDAPLTEMTLEQWTTVLGVNLTGMFLCTRAAARAMIGQGPQPSLSRATGKILCISSVHEIIPWAGHVNYAASKGGVKLFMQSVAQELAPHRIRVNSIAPGAIQTPINRPAWETPDALRALLTLVPYGRIGVPEDVGRAAAWLASDAADYVHGQTIVVDGGMTLYPEFARGG